MVFIEGINTMSDPPVGAIFKKLLWVLKFYKSLNIKLKRLRSQKCVMSHS